MAKKRRTLSPLLAAASLITMMWINYPHLEKYAEMTPSGEYKYSFVTTDSFGTTVQVPNSTAQTKLATAIRAFPNL